MHRVMEIGVGVAVDEGGETGVIGCAAFFHLISEIDYYRNFKILIHQNIYFFLLL